MFNHVSKNTLIRSINMPNVIESSKTGGFRRYILIGPPLAQHVGMGQYCAIINSMLHLQC